MRSLTLCTLLLVAPAAAQGFAVYIPDSDPTTGTCNVIPFGNTAGSTSWSNQRMQTLATAAQLNNIPGIVTGLRFAACNTGLHTSSTIRITLAHVPAGFSLAANTDFDANLNVLGSNATVVLDQVDYTWEMTTDTWSSIGFDGSFVFNGVDDVLIDLLVTGNAAVNTGSASMHRATQPRLVATGWAGAPPATGRVSNSALKMGVEFGCSGLSIYGAGCDGVTLALSGSATLGNTINAELGGGDSGLPCAVFFGVQNSSPFPIDLTPLGLTGCRIYNDTAASLFGVADAAGQFAGSFAAPNSPSLVGVRIYAQGAAIKLSAPGGGASSNGGRILFGSDCGELVTHSSYKLERGRESGRQGAQEPVAWILLRALSLRFGWPGPARGRRCR